MDYSKDIILSVIIPFYKGNQYINHALSCVFSSKVSDEFLRKCEIIIINDSPEEDVKICAKYRLDNVIIKKNEKNVGIHKTRVNGLKLSRGKYVIFADQDDELYLETIEKNIETIMRYDCNIFNAKLTMHDNGYRMLYPKKIFGQMATYLYTYLYVGNQIVSPGQVVLKKEVIPNLWKTRNLNRNGADDAMLWILCLASKARIKYLDKISYNHIYTGYNTSCDMKLMLESTKEYIEIICEESNLHNSCKNILKRRLKFHYLYHSKNWMSRLKMFIWCFDIVIIKTVFKLTKRIYQKDYK